MNSSQCPESECPVHRLFPIVFLLFAAYAAPGADLAQESTQHGDLDIAVSLDAAGMTFAVTDTGIGIPAEHLATVLQPFVQVDSSLSRRREGTGLGLALVKVMAELHGGSLRLDSEVGRGTTASVILPHSRVNLTARTDSVPENATSSWTPERVIA